MQRPQRKILLARALKLRCPRCGRGQLFSGWFRMHERCSVCGLRYERAPGYFLGSAYVNYGITALTITAAYIAMHFVAQWENRYIVPPLAAFCVVFPLFFFRYARALWLAMDAYFDPEGFERDHD